MVKFHYKTDSDNYRLTKFKETAQNDGLRYFTNYSSLLSKKFYIDKKAVKDSVSDCDLDKMQNNKRIIKMRKPNRPDENKYKDMALIDIEKL